MSQQALLLSVKPKYAEKILAGEKTVELRRTRPRAVPGSPILLYASSPKKSLLGRFVVERIIECNPVKLWKLVKHQAGVTKTEFDAYYLGAKRAVAIFITRVIALSSPVELADLRTAIPGFQPPQSFGYIQDDHPLADFLGASGIRTKRKG